MTVFEMHNAVNQRFQEVASYKRDKLFPEEIDLVLNKAMERFIHEKVDQNLEDKQVNLVGIQQLVVKNRALPVIIPLITDDIYEDHMVYSVLPPELKYLLSTRTEVITSTTDCENAPSLATTSLSEWTAVLDLNEVLFNPVGVAPFFEGFTVYRSGSVSIYNAPAPFNSGFNSNRSGFRILHDLLDTVNTRDTAIRIYYEKYREHTHRQSLVVVTSSNLGTVTAATADSIDSTVSDTLTETVYTTYNRNLIADLENASLSLVQAKPTETALLYSLLTQNKYYKTRPSEPLVHQAGQYLMAYKDKSFLITRMVVDYIRKPQQIDLALNKSCELDSAVHDSIIDMAVEILLLDTSSPKYEATLKNNEIRNKD